MSRVKVMQQALDPTGYGGVSVEYRALKQSALADRYEFVPLILHSIHRGISIKDIRYYRQRIREERPDIVQIRGANIDGLNAVIAAKLAGCTRSMYCIHGMVSDNVYTPRWKKLIFRWCIERLGFLLADGISCVYEQCAERENFRPFRKKMLPFVYNRMPDYSGVDRAAERKRFRQQYGIADDALVALFCGRMSREKGLDYYAQAIKLYRESWPQELQFVMVGDGDYLASFRSMLEVDLQKRVVFTGGTMNVVPALAAADFFVMPSLHENHSIALLEALAMQLPCIVTDVGGNCETVISDRYGIAIPAFDEQALADAILRMCDRETRKKYIAAIANGDFYRFSNPAVDAQLDSAYRALLSRIRV